MCKALVEGYKDMVTFFRNKDALIENMALVPEVKVEFREEENNEERNTGKIKDSKKQT